MTGEQFHDALTLLSEDLIAKADEARSRKPQIIHWRRYASLAACCALLILCGVLYQNRPAKSTSSEMAKSYSAADAAPEMAEAAQAPASGDLGDTETESAVPVCLEVPDLSDGAAGSAFPMVSIFVNRESLDDRLAEMGKYYEVSELEAACEGFDGSFFDSQDLLLIFSQDVTGNCEFRDITWTEGGCTVKIAIHQRVGGETTNFATLIPAPKGEIDPANVTVVYIIDANP